MPLGRRPPGGWLAGRWATDVNNRVVAVLAAARTSGKPNLVLGAFGGGFILNVLVFYASGDSVFLRCCSRCAT